MNTDSSSGTTFWHGGAPGLQIGEVIVPRDQLPMSSLERHLKMESDDPTETGRVYITTNRRFAIAFALRHSNSPFQKARTGAVYRVEPVGPLTVDPDFPNCFSVDRAVIIEVDRARMTGPPSATLKTLGPFMTWTDGRPVYTVDGWMTVCPRFQELGVTDKDLRRAGKWAAVSAVGADPDTGQLLIDHHLGQPGDRAALRALERQLAAEYPPATTD